MLGWGTLSAAVYDLESYANVAITLTILLYSLLYVLLTKKKNNGWLWIKELNVLLGAGWFAFYFYLSIRDVFIQSWPPISHEIVRHCITITLAVMAAASVIRVRSEGVGSLKDAYKNLWYCRKDKADNNDASGDC